MGRLDVYMSSLPAQLSSDHFTNTAAVSNPQARQDLPCVVGYSELVPVATVN